MLTVTVLVFLFRFLLIYSAVSIVATLGVCYLIARNWR